MTLETKLGLFENSRESNITSAIAMVEDVLLELGHFINQCRDAPTAQELPAWCLAKGSARVRIALVDRDDGSANALHLRAASVVMTMDRQVDEVGLYRHLLELNAEAITGAAFGVSGNEVVLAAERPALDLDRSEVYDLVTRVQSYADDFDDKLVAAFGGTLGASG